MHQKGSINRTLFRIYDLQNIDKHDQFLTSNKKCVNHKYLSK